MKSEFQNNFDIILPFIETLMVCCNLSDGIVKER